MSDKLREVLNIVEVDRNNKIEKEINWLFTTEGYKSMPIVAARLSRLLSHMKSGTPFALISGFRYNLSMNENIQRNKELAMDIRRNGFGFIQVEGVWKGVDDEGQPYESKENTFFVIGFDSETQYKVPYEEFKSSMLALQRKYEQEGVIMGYYTDDDKYFMELTNKEGETDIEFKNVSIPSEKQLAEMFEKSKESGGTGHTNLKNKKFIFSGIYSYHPMSMYSAGNAYNEKYLYAAGTNPIPWNKKELKK